MFYPEKLKEGAVIGLIAPSSAVTKEREIQCRKVLENMGFKVVMADNLHADYGGFAAGDAKTRAGWVNKMFADQNIDAIFCIRGGDGGNRIVDYLDLDVIRKNKKIFVGYSDITCLHLILNQKCDLITFHGPMVSSNMADGLSKEEETSLFNALNGDEEYRYEAPKDYPIMSARAGSACGTLVGGNLTLVCTSIGTPYEIDTKGKILFIEEVGGMLGNMDRDINQLRLSGKLSDAAGLILGQFEEVEWESENYSPVDAFLDAVGDLDIPIMYNIQSGHGKPMMTLPLGAECRMNTETKELVFKINR